MTENQRRYRGNRILQAILDDIRGDTRWIRIRHTPPGVGPPPRGLYHPPTGKIDTQAGRKGSPAGPEATLITIQEEPRIHYPGETITATRHRYMDLYTRLSRAHVLTAVREWARMEKPSPIAAYWPSHGAVRWTHHPPDDLKPHLRRAVDIVGEHTPLTQTLDTPEPTFV